MNSDFNSKEDPNITFTAYDYTSEDSFVKSKYEFIKVKKNENEGWLIKRNGEEYLTLGSGYSVLKTKFCGICSTDLMRRFLPFPLPQVLGHEFVAEDLKGEANYVVEISDSCILHEEKHLEIFCKNGLKSHCPDRYVIGINTLLGGFSPYVIVPNKAMIKYNKEIISDYSAIFIEPLAAAFNAVYTSYPNNAQSVAVVGVRKLGALIIASLKAYRKKNNLSFKICAIVRRQKLFDLCLKMGADEVLDSTYPINQTFDIVYDASGSESGFKLSLSLANKELHLKTTNGLTMCKMKNLTAMVVDEICILNFDSYIKSLNNDFSSLNDKLIYISPKTNIDFKFSNSKIFSEDLDSIDPSIFSNESLFSNKLPRFDLCVVSTLDEIDRVIRPFKETENSLIKPKGYILYKPKENESDSESEIIQFLNRGHAIRTSRCGDFHIALSFVEEDSILRESLQNLITDIYPVDEIEQAFNKARSENSIKVIVKQNL